MRFAYPIIIILAVTITATTRASNAASKATGRGFSLILQIVSVTNGVVKLKVPVPANGSDLCLRHSSGRGAGTALRVQCNNNEDQNGGLCYPKCRAGYQSFGCCVCNQQCPSGFTDDGASACIKPAAYGRGAGYSWKFRDGFSSNGMFQRCEADYGAGNCEKYGAIVYPKCRSNFHATGCCACTPDCPSGMRNIGVSCAKDTYGRGVGVSRLTCAANQEQDGGLCYAKCPNGFRGAGPVCWQNCSRTFSYECGVMCTKDQSTCAIKTTSIVLSALKVGGDIFKGVRGDPLAIIAASLRIADVVIDVTSNPYC